MAVILIVSGLCALVFGAGTLIKGASNLGTRFGLSPLIVGLTIVAYGTSAPELAVSAQAAFFDQDDISFGNIVGSNIVNILLILGLSAFITPITVSASILKRDIPLLIGISTALWFCCGDGRLEWYYALLLLFGLFLLTIWTISSGSGAETEQEEQLNPATQQHWLKSSLFVIAGLACLAGGSELLVSGASQLATAFGISELSISLSIVAIGTSCPELATSLIAAWKGQRDIAIGNVVGSNLFNILGVAGICGLLSPDGLTLSSNITDFDLPFMAGITIMCLPLARSDFLLNRYEGCYLILGYAAYLSAILCHALVMEQETAVLHIISWTWIGSGCFFALFFYFAKNTVHSQPRQAKN